MKCHVEVICIVPSRSHLRQAAEELGELRGERLEGVLVGGLVAGEERRLGRAGAALAEVGPQLPQRGQLRVDLVLELAGLNGSMFGVKFELKCQIFKLRYSISYLLSEVLPRPSAAAPGLGRGAHGGCCGRLFLGSSFDLFEFSPVVRERRRVGHLRTAFRR